MSVTNSACVACAIVALSGAASAATPMTSYSSQAGFLAAVTTVSTDTFDNLPAGNDLGNSVTRTTGAFSYTASAFEGLYAIAGTGSDNWLSTDAFSDTLSLAGFSNNVYAVGGQFFGTDISGQVLISQSSQTPQTLVFNVLDTAGNTFSTQVVLGAQTTFFGVLSSAPIVSFSVYVYNNFFEAYPTANNLVLAAVPEPTSVALLLLGLGSLACIKSKRRSDA